MLKMKISFNPDVYNAVLSNYVKKSPHHQNAIDIFKNEWSSKLPSGLRAGDHNLFDNDLIKWAEKEMGGFKNQTFLELGPLEAGQTYMLEKRGAQSILAIESHTRAFLKCLIVKEIYGLKNSNFLLGDFIEFLKDYKGKKFDVCLASGVLYHMINPVELLFLISRVSDKIILWTHYYDRDIIGSDVKKSYKFGKASTETYNGFSHVLHRYNYLNAMDSAAFCGGSNPYSNWMTRDDILKLLGQLGYQDIRIKADVKEMPNGSVISLVALRGKKSVKKRGTQKK